MVIEPQMLKVILFFYCLPLTTISLGQKSIVGSWELSKVAIYNVKTKVANVMYDRTNSDSLKLKLVNQFLLEQKSEPKAEDEEVIDSLEFTQILEREFKNFSLARISLKENFTAILKSYGIIVPNVIPGWHIGDEVKCKWQLKGETLTFYILNKIPNSKISFKIIDKSPSSLIISEIDETNNYKILYLIRK